MQERYLRIACAPDKIAEVCDFVVQEAYAAGLDAREAHYCSLAVDEACANIIEHGVRDELRDATTDQSCIEVCCRAEADQLTIQISDDSFAFDPLSVPAPNPQTPIHERGTGGWGIFFIRKLMDEVQYRSQDGRNILTMVKYAAKQGKTDRLQPTATAPADEHVGHHGAGKLTFSQRLEGMVLLTFTGNYDSQIANTLAEALPEYIEGGNRYFILDLSQVSRMTSGGIKLLINLWLRLRSQKAHLVLVSVPSHLRELLELSGLDMIFMTAPSVEEAEKLLIKRK